MVRRLPMTELSEALADVTAAVEQARAAEAELDKAREQLREAVVRAHRLGASYTLLGKLIGVSRQRAARIAGEP
jgi:hypothetical protein